MYIDEVRTLAEQKNKKTPAKTTAKKTETKSAKSSEKKTETKSAEKSKKETTKVNAKPARFGDSLLDEVILLLIILLMLVRIWFLRRKINKQVDTLDEYEEVLKKYGLLVDGELIARAPMEQIHAKK